MELAFLGLQTIFSLLVVIYTTCSKRRIIQRLMRKEEIQMNDKVTMRIEFEVPQVLSVLFEDGKLSVTDLLVLYKYFADIKVLDTDTSSETKTVIIDERRN